MNSHYNVWRWYFSDGGGCRRGVPRNIQLAFAESADGTQLAWESSEEDAHSLSGG